MKCIENIAKLLIRFSETCEDDGSFDIGIDEAKALALLGYLNRPFRNRLFFELTSQGQQLIAAYTRPSSRGKAVAYLHHVVVDDGKDTEQDLALSFFKDSFPLDSMGWRSVECEPLFKAPAPGVVAGEVEFIAHKFWGAGEADCPKDIKSSNGELHTLRCKVCGKDNNKEPCKAAITVTDDMVDVAYEAYADMYDVEYTQGSHIDNRRACIRAALTAAIGRG